MIGNEAKRQDRVFHSDTYYGGWGRLGTTRTTRDDRMPVVY